MNRKLNLHNVGPYNANLCIKNLFNLVETTCLKRGEDVGVPRRAS